MVDFVQMIVSGVAVGSSYALMGLAMVIIYKTSEVPNFAQGEMALISTYFAFMIIGKRVPLCSGKNLRISLAVSIFSCDSTEICSAIFFNSRTLPGQG